jgi:putative lipoic acid-binding regulatory protein
MANESLLTFPCALPVKIFGRNRPGFRETVVAIVRTHDATIDEAKISEHLSREGRFVSLTVTVHAESRVQVDALYTELSAHADVLMVL